MGEVGLMISRSPLLILVAAAFLGSAALSAGPTPAGKEAAPAPRSSPSPAAVTRCDAHGVKQSVCARCKPKLAAAFKAKGDWCDEHQRPESQCAICKPSLTKEGIKP